MSAKRRAAKLEEAHVEVEVWHGRLMAMQLLAATGQYDTELLQCTVDGAIQALALWDALQ